MKRGVLADPAAHKKLRKTIPTRLRAYILQRDHGVCQNPMCRSGNVPPEKLEIHHLNHDIADIRPGNLALSCGPCNKAAKNEHYRCVRRMNHLMRSLRIYKSNQLSFNYE